MIEVFDFDGVILDSVGVKSRGFLTLFQGASEEERRLIESHHLKYGGMNRTSKIKLYMSWLKYSIEDLPLYVKRFSENIVDAVLECDYVPGSKEYLSRSKTKKIVLTGTPQEEIEVILKELGINIYFDEVYGFPFKKSEVLQALKSKYKTEELVFYGDSYSDYRASCEAEVRFIGINPMPPLSPEIVTCYLNFNDVEL